MKFIDLTGQRFTRLRVIRKIKKPGNKRTFWLCECDCGKCKIVEAGHLKCGDTRSCGCHKISISTERLTRHGKSNTPEYAIWATLIQRCTNKSNKSFKYYGGRGIGVCDRWANSFTNFIADMGERPSQGHSIDRIDNDGNYTPGNCRWATLSVQRNNRSDNRLITYHGQTKTLAQWVRASGLKKHIIEARIKRGWSIGRVFTQKVRKISKRGETCTGKTDKTTERLSEPAP